MSNIYFSCSPLPFLVRSLVLLSVEDLLIPSPGSILNQVLLNGQDSESSLANESLSHCLPLWPLGGSCEWSSTSKNHCLRMKNSYNLAPAQGDFVQTPAPKSLPHSFCVQYCMLAFPLILKATQCLFKESGFVLMSARVSFYCSSPKNPKRSGQFLLGVTDIEENNPCPYLSSPHPPSSSSFYSNGLILTSS